MDDEHRGDTLVDFARGTIACALGGPAVARPSGEWFAHPAATVVTITRRGRLHGCIGSVEPTRLLVDDVEHNALAAAFRDPRSARFRAEWLPEMGVEVTLLSPLAPIACRDEAEALRVIQPDVDGIVLRYGIHRAT